MKYLGIDFGKKFIGLAVSDDDGLMAFPYSVIDNTREAIEKISKMIGQEKIGEIVMGWSLDQTGAENEVAAQAKDFAEKILEKKKEIPLHLEPEWYTTQAAKRLPTGEMGDANDHKDAEAAALILDSYLRRQQK